MVPSDPVDAERLALWFNDAVRVDRFPLPIVMQAYPDRAGGEPVVRVRVVMVSGVQHRLDVTLSYALVDLLRADAPTRLLARRAFDDVAELVKQDLAACWIVDPTEVRRE